MINIRELHEFDGPVLGYYAKGDHALHDFINALDQYGATDYDAEVHAPLVECINWEWWRWMPTNDPDLPGLAQMNAKMVPSQGAFQVTVWWVNPIDGQLGAHRWHLDNDMKGAVRI